MSPTHIELALAELNDRFAEQLTTNQSLREQHGHDESGWESMPPDAVLFARSTSDVSEAMKICHRHQVPVIAFGTGTAVEGHVQAVKGGLCIDLGQMNSVLDISQADMDCRVEAGVTRHQLARELQHTGLFFSVDPGADATLGGMAATGASGTNTVRYGTIRENIRGLTVVLADGRVIKTGSRARKSSAGYDLTHLFIGSEGTLGIITELIVRLHGVQDGVSTAVCGFPTISAAVETVIQTIQFGIPVARMELLDAQAMNAIRLHSGLAYPSQPHLFMEFHGSENGVREQAEQVQEIAAEMGGETFQWATRSEERNRILRARHDAYPAALQTCPGCKPITSDVCVPISRLAECISETEKLLASDDLPSIILGHVGDGNFHVLLMPAADNPVDIDRARAINHQIIELALGMEGTCTGEHGIGMGKIEFLAREHPTGVPVMQQIKAALDPQGILNPGKLFAQD